MRQVLCREEIGVNTVARFLHPSAIIWPVGRKENEVNSTPGKSGREPEAVETERQAASRSSATQRVADKAHQTIDRAAEAATEAEKSVRSTAAKAAEKVKLSEERAAETIDESMQSIKTYVEKNPLASAGIAFAAGLVVSMLIRR